MSLARRIAELYQAKVNALLDRAEDPREMLGYSYVQQQEFLRVVRSAVTDVAASRKRAEVQENELRRAADRLRARAAQALTAGKEDLGRGALAHCAEMIAHADDLAAERMALHVEEERLSDEARRLEARFEVVRYRKEALKAAYTAAKAASAGTLAGTRVAAGDVAEAARRTEDQTAALQARAQALSEQIKVGMPETPPSPEGQPDSGTAGRADQGRSGRGGTGQDQGAAGRACQETAARRIPGTAD
jgi:phage shock protein A